MAERVVIEGPGRRVPEAVVDVGASWSRSRDPMNGFREGEFERYRCPAGDPCCHAELLLRVAAGEEP